MTDVSVVIPTWNAGPLFQRTLDKIREQRDCGEVDLVVVDSQSSDGTVAMAQEAGARVRTVLRATFNHGLTRNLGAALAKGQAVAFLTQDAEPANDRWLANLREGLEGERVAGVYARVLPRPDCSPLVERSVRNDLVHSPHRLLKPGEPERIEAMSPFERRVFFHFNNVSSMVRREVLNEIPFPDIPFGEDLAWGGAVLRAGWNLLYEPRAVIIHSHESRLWEDFSRHRSDAVLMRTLFGFRNRDGLHDSLPAWIREVRADSRFLKNRGLGRSAWLKWITYSCLLRGFQIAGQLAGSYRPVVVPRFDASLPVVEMRSE